jgi:aspartate kinase
MKTVVLKFGGTSVGSIDRIKKVCKNYIFLQKEEE